MLFLHKGADTGIHHAVFTGARPKDNRDAYEFIDEIRGRTVKKNVNYLAPRLGVPFRLLPHLESVLDNWLRSTAYDRRQLDIYGMMSPEGMSERKKANLPAEWRYYNNYVDLVLALNGEALSAENMVIESTLAQLVLTIARPRELITAAAKKITQFAEFVFEEDKRDALLQGKYATLHAPYTWRSWSQALNNGLPTNELVPCLYDITMSFKKPLKWSEAPMAGGRITKTNMRMNVATPNEDSNWSAAARRTGVPIWAAPSYTAHLMLLVAQKAGATETEIQAFAYGIYAYWNQDYPQTATPIHRMFGVMTAAHEFGVSDRACDPSTMYIELENFLSFVKSNL